MFRYFVVIIVGLGLCFGQVLLSQAVQPEIATNLALDQFANPAVETDTAMRLLNSLFLPVSGLVWLIYLFFGYKILFFRKVKEKDV